MAHTVENGCDLLPLSKVEELEPKARKAYNEAAAKFVDEFNAAYPDGKQVKVNIQDIVIGQNGRVNFVIGKQKDLSTQSIGLPFVVTDRIAENLGCGTTEGLISLKHSTIEPLMLTMTVRAVKEGDDYKTTDGTTKTYKAYAMVKVADSREEVVLSDDARDIIARMQEKVLHEEILRATRERRRGSKTAAKTSTVVVTDDEADV